MAGFGLQWRVGAVAIGPVAKSDRNTRGIDNVNPQNDKAEPSANPDAQPAFSAAGLLDDLWHHLKVLDGRCTKSMAIALTRRGYDQIEGQRAMARELQSYLLAHGYSSNNQALRPATEGEPERNKTNL